MNYQLQDLQRMRTSKTYIDKPVKSVRSDDIQSHVQAFLARGGRIQEVPQGISGEDEAFKRYAITMSKAQKNSERTKARAKSFGITEAARCIGVSHGWLNAQCELGKGPPYYLSGKRKQFLRDEVLAWWKNREASEQP
jgi:hypothetical protein